MGSIRSRSCREEFVHNKPSKDNRQLVENELQKYGRKVHNRLIDNTSVPLGGGGPIQFGGGPPHFLSPLVTVNE